MRAQKCWCKIRDAFDKLNTARTCINIHTGDAVHILIFNLNFIILFPLPFANVLTSNWYRKCGRQSNLLACGVIRLLRLRGFILRSTLLFLGLLRCRPRWQALSASKSRMKCFLLNVQRQIQSSKLQIVIFSWNENFCFVYSFNVYQIKWKDEEMKSFH